MRSAWTLLLIGVWTISAAAQEEVVIDNFEEYRAGEAPHSWSTPNSRNRELEPLQRKPERDNDYFEIVKSGGETYLRAYTNDETVQIARRNGDGFQWDLGTHPVLQWRWRAVQLPHGASERTRRRNDTGAALYVLFNCGDWLGRPCSVKYTYSSALPLETTVRYGPLRVLVVSTALAGTDRWINVERNVAEDLTRLFHLRSTPEPVLIMLWSDSDTTHGVAEVYFDDIVIQPDQ